MTFHSNKEESLSPLSMMKPLEDAKDGDLILNQRAARGNRLCAARYYVYTEEC